MRIHLSIVWLCCSIFPAQLVFGAPTPSGASAQSAATPSTVATTAPSTQTTPSAASSAVNAAKAKVKKIKSSFASQRTILLKYAKVDWNKSSTEIDSATVLFKDKSTGKVTQVTLQETEPDSAIFSGLFGITWTEASGDMTPEVYLPPQEIFAKPDGFKQLQSLMTSGKIPSMPVFFYEDDGQQTIDVYDTKEKVAEARNLFIETKEVKKAAAAAATSPKQKEVRDKLADSVFEAAQMAKIEAERKKAAAEALKREADRIRLMEVERQKIEKQKAEMLALAESERKKRREEAAKYAATAMKHYTKGEFVEAETQFAKSSSLDPDNKQIYYFYGITLYRNQKFNDSLVKLETAEVVGMQIHEKNFYLALNHYRLKEITKAMQEFESIRKAEVKGLGPSSAFYMGLLEFEQTHYEKAKPYFQEVLDTSEDPKLDEQADNYIEKIERILEFARNKAKTFIVTLSTGAQYDSNILLVSNTTLDQAPPSAIGDTRASGGLGIQWRPVYDKAYEWSLKLKGDTIYTLKSSFAQADPIIYSAMAPFVYKGMFLGKGYKLEVKPGYEMLYLDGNNDGTKESLINSALFDWGNTFVMSENWFSSYNFKFRSDTGVTDDASTAKKITVNLNNIYFLDKKKTQGVIGDLSYSSNAANGSAYKYTRVDAGAMYLAPLPAEFTFTGGISYYTANYSELTPVKTDSNITLLTVFNRTLTSWLTSSLTGMYIINNSTIESSAYKKYTVGLTFNAEFSF